MGYIFALITSALCLFFYIRMYRRETQESMAIWKAILPAALGGIGPHLATLLTIGFNLGIIQILGRPFREFTANAIANSLISSFFLAGFTEELVKLIFLIIAVKIIKPRHVYEYGLLGAAVGVGFTCMEEFAYVSDDMIVSLIRLPIFGMHMVLGLIMGLGLGMAKHCKQTGQKGSGCWAFLGLFIPVLWHTLYDSATATNPALLSQDTTVTYIGISFAGIMFVGSFVMQFVVLIMNKKKAEYNCRLSIKW